MHSLGFTQRTHDPTAIPHGFMCLLFALEVNLVCFAPLAWHPLEWGEGGRIIPGHKIILVMTTHRCQDTMQVSRGVIPSFCYSERVHLVFVTLTGVCF